VRGALFVLLLTIASAASPQAADVADAPIDQVVRCGNAAPADAIGLTALEEACPGLTEALDRSGYLAYLSAPLREELRGDQLTDLQPLAERYDAPAGIRPLGTDSLDSILASLREAEQDRPLTLFERLKRSLRRLLERQGNNSSNWLSEWLRDVTIPDAVSQGIVFGAIVLVILLALAVVLNELRAAGVFRRDARDRSRDDGNRARAGAAQRMVDSLQGEGEAPALLRLLVGTLVVRGRLRGERALTHRELCTHARFDDDAQRATFSRIAMLAEQTVYAGTPVPPEELQSAAAAARALNERLSEART
jgi:hypothetical protein